MALDMDAMDGYMDGMDAMDGWMRWMDGWNGCNGWIHGWIAHETSHSTCALIALGPGCAPRVENDFHVPREPGRAPYDEGTIIRSHSHLHTTLDIL